MLKSVVKCSCQPVMITDKNFIPIMQKLNLSNNQIIDLPDRAFGYFRQLKYLDLSFNRISFLNVTANRSNISPVRFFPDMSQLYYLNLSNNRLLDLQPGIVSGLEHLINQDLSNNRISVIRAGTFANLPKLERMFLQNNNISELTGICDDFHELKYLYLSSNNIPYLPEDCFTECGKLVLLDLSDNRLSDQSLDLLTYMEIMHVNVSHNGLLRLNIEHLRLCLHILRNTVSKIQWMDFSHNEISTVDLWLLEIANHCYGCYIDLSYNRIKHFVISDAFLAMSPHFEKDNLFHPASITLDLKGNDIIHIIDMDGWGFGHKNALWGALLKTNKQPIVLIDSLVCDCRDYAVKKYNMQNDFSMDLTQVICSSPTKLINVNLAAISIDDMVCDIEYHCPSKCNCSEQPSTNSTIINCTDTGLTDLPATLPTLNRLPGLKYYLLLSENHISRLTFKDYINETTRLDISSSGVNEIDPRMWQSYSDDE